MITHSVIFNLKPELSNEQKDAFFKEVNTLKSIKTIHNFEVLEQISSKNHFEYGISMQFENQNDYDFYTNHPIHSSFVKNNWAQNIADFLEIDYKIKA